MKHCPACQQTYADDLLTFCLNDGAQLVSATPSDSPETLHIPSPRSTDPMPSQETWRAGPSFATPVAQAPQRNWLPWVLGVAGLLIVGLFAIVFIAGVIYYKLGTSSDSNSETPSYNSNTSKSDTGKRKPDGTSSSSTSSSSKDSLANTSARSVTELAPQQVGDYKLGGVKSPQGHLFKNEGSTELMMATYDLPDNSNFVLLYLGSFASADSARAALKEIVRWSVKQGAQIDREEQHTGRGGEQLGLKYVLVSDKGVEDVYWSNGRYAFNAYNGKKETGVLTAFEKAYPY